MKGLIIKYDGKEYRAAFPDKNLNFIMNMSYGAFSLTVGGVDGHFIQSGHMAKEGIEVEIEMAEFEDVSEIITSGNLARICPVDPECRKLLEEQQSDEAILKRKLEIFRNTEAVLKEEGLI